MLSDLKGRYREEYRLLYEEFALRPYALLEILTKDTGIPIQCPASKSFPLDLTDSTHPTGIS